jgi:hypothetical protein
MLEAIHVDFAGSDPAWGAVEDARRLAGSRPLRFEVAEHGAARLGGFDVAFSHEVLYRFMTSPATLERSSARSRPR